MRSQVVTIIGELGLETWDMDNTVKPIHEAGFSGVRTGLALSPDGAFVVCPQSHLVQLSSTTNNGGAGHFLDGPTTWGEILVTAFSPDGNYVVFSAGDGLIHVDRLLDNKEVGRGFQDTKSPVKCLAVSPGASSVLIATDTSVTLRSLPDGKHKRSFLGLKKVSSMAFAPDGKHLVVGEIDGTIRVWDLDGNLSAKSNEHKEPVAVWPSRRTASGSRPAATASSYGFGRRRKLSPRTTTTNRRVPRANCSADMRALSTASLFVRTARRSSPAAATRRFAFGIARVAKRSSRSRRCWALSPV